MPIDYRTSFRSTDVGEMFTSNTEREFNVRCSMSGSQNAIATNFYGFIDLSDTVNWPHDSTTYLHISYIALLLDKENAARGTISTGIVTRINEVDATIVYLSGINFTNNSANDAQIIANFSPSQLKCEIENERLKYAKTNSVVVAETGVNTSTPLPFGPGGATFIPAVGDMIIRVATTSTSVVNWGFTTFYHTHPDPLD